MLDVKKILTETNLIEDFGALNKYLDIISKNNLDGVNLHHKIPKSFFKSLNLNEGKVDNSSNNLVNLTYENHIKAHYYIWRMLKKCNLKNKHAFVVCSMINERFGINIKNISTISELDFLNFISSTDWQTIYSDRITSCTGENNPAYGVNYWNTYSDEKKDSIRLKHSEARKGISHSEETKKKISLKNKGKIITEETKIKISLNHANCSGSNNAAYGRHWYNNGARRLYLKDTDEIPEGFVRGNLPQSAEEKFKRSLSNKGKHSTFKGRHWRVENGKRVWY